MRGTWEWDIDSTSRRNCRRTRRLGICGLVWIPASRDLRFWASRTLLEATYSIIEAIAIVATFESVLISEIAILVCIRGPLCGYREMVGVVVGDDQRAAPERFRWQVGLMLMGNAVSCGSQYNYGVHIDNQPRYTGILVLDFAITTHFWSRAMGLE